MNFVESVKKRRASRTPHVGIRTLIAICSPKSLFIILLAAIIDMVVYEFYGIHKPARYAWIADLGEITYNLALAYVASYWFYLAVVYVPHVRDQYRLRDYIARRLHYITHSSREFMMQLNNRSTEPVKDIESFTKDELRAMLRHLNLTQDSPKVKSITNGILYATWTEYAVEFLDQSLQAGRDLSFISTYIDADLMKLTDAVLTCRYFEQLSPVVIVNQGWLMNMTNDLYNYYRHAQALKAYAAQRRLDRHWTDGEELPVA